MNLKPMEIEIIRSGSTAVNARKNSRQTLEENWNSTRSGRLLRCKKAAEWLIHEQRHPDLKPLFGNFWLETELCILFADTNLGKSILAVQIADSLTRDYCIGPFKNNFSADTRVLYVDCELSTRQFMIRYTDDEWGSHGFSDQFYRGELHPDMEDPVRAYNYENYIRNELEAAITDVKPQVLIIDNITYMRRGTQSTGEALPLMKMLKALKAKHHLSILVLAHTPKRNACHPLTVNDLQGSKMLINFADSALAIGQSQTQPHLRYLKQIKQRSRDEQYGADNVCLISREKEMSFLGFKFEGYANEADHLRKPELGATDGEKQMVLDLHNQGKTLRQIANELGMHFTSVGRIVRREKQRRVL